ncbi:phage baseplate assembly protein V [Stenomitos frigidus]|uniref:Phage tail protein n=1 Tax=Stenomitos frigidus ULC18 TaxID=2107698 RepID=A0A2T1ENX5_9CYAN|nr:phage baseplate assembly protein V [Stenomitos frigidus]PSB34415.1 phage tail protein [Stenomitos frigidus ULC18]
MPLGDLVSLLAPVEASDRINGVTIAIVTNVQDPKKLGRVKVKLPLLSMDDESDWVRMLTPMAGNGQGFYCFPQVNDEVLVGFEQGDPQRPYVLGALWSASAMPPQAAVSQRQLVSRSGHKIILDDTEGSERVEIRDRTGKNRITIISKDNSLVIETEGEITIQAKGKLTLSGKGVDIDAQGSQVNFKASQMEVK